jgi:hypothetical protein
VPGVAKVSRCGDIRANNLLWIVLRDEKSPGSLRDYIFRSLLFIETRHQIVAISHTRGSCFDHPSACNRLYVYILIIIRHRHVLDE